MDIVALLGLATAVEVEAPLLAAALGMMPYEAALLLRSPSPTLLLRTDDRARALALLGEMRGRGHDVIACDGRSVVSSDAMSHVKSFRLEPEGLAITTALGTPDHLAWFDVIAVVRAIHRTRTEHVEKTTERKFDMGRAAMSGGLLMSKKVTNEKVHTSEDREQVLYVFRQGAAPLLFAQSRMRYDGLGEELRPSQIENFTRLIGLLRERAPRAAYDERLLAARPASEKLRAGVNGAVSASSSDGVDLLAHLVAMAISRAPPYRSNAPSP